MVKLPTKYASSCRSTGSADRATSDTPSKTEINESNDPENGMLHSSSASEIPRKLKQDESRTGKVSTGQAYLIAVAALWGSYAPALR